MTQWFLSGRKSRQAVRRGWTIAEIDGVVQSPIDTASGINRATKHSATYYYREDGHYVVRDDVTGEIIQVSDRTNPRWIDELTGQRVVPR